MQHTHNHFSSHHDQKYPHLLADIGGTNARFALKMPDQHIEQIHIFSCAHYPDLAAAIRAYLAHCGHPTVYHAGVAIANPVTSDTIKMTNHDWHFSIEHTRQTLGLHTLLVINDFTALAQSLPYLDHTHYVQIGQNGVARPRSAIGLVGAGTGLGVSGLIPAGEDQWISLNSEGGHVSFAPTDQREAKILDWMWQKHTHVSVERLISGPGIIEIYKALMHIHHLAADDINAQEIVRRAQTQACAVCAEVLQVFSSMLGGVASNIALTLGSFGGVYIGGGVANQLGHLFDHALFRQRFEAKGRFTPYLTDIPTYLITTPCPAFLGVAAMLNAQLKQTLGHNISSQHSRQTKTSLP